MKTDEIEKLLELLHKVNLAANPEEREAWNALKCQLWGIADRLRDYSRMPTMADYMGGEMAKQCEALWDIVQELPVLGD